MFGATCAAKEKHNCCVSVTGYKPRRVATFVDKRGKRAAAAVEEVVQECDAWFGFFNSDQKPNSQRYNMQRGDMNSITKFGFSIHGEWFLNGERVPLKGGSAHLHPLPSGNVPENGDVANGKPWTLKDAPLRDPDFPELERTSPSPTAVLARLVMLVYFPCLAPCLPPYLPHSWRNNCLCPVVSR